MVQDIVPENEFDPCSRLEGEVICRDFGCVEYCEFLGVGKVCRCLAMYVEVGCPRRVFRKV